MIKIELSEQHLGVILESLAAMPLGKSFDAFVAIRSQMAQQQAARTVAAQAMTTAPPAPPTTPPNGADHTE
jgi:hypothetical protein